jgi:hypothetical protein
MATTCVPRPHHFLLRRLVIYRLDEAESNGSEDPLARFVPQYPIAGVTL